MGTYKQGWKDTKCGWNLETLLIPAPMNLQKLGYRLRAVAAIRVVYLLGVSWVLVNPIISPLLLTYLEDLGGS